MLAGTYINPSSSPTNFVTVSKPTATCGFAMKSRVLVGIDYLARPSYDIDQ
jgi:hypothetical protein